jgi:hypothetical protein
MGSGHRRNALRSQLSLSRCIGASLGGGIAAKGLPPSLKIATHIFSRSTGFGAASHCAWCAPVLASIGSRVTKMTPRTQGQRLLVIRRSFALLAVFLVLLVTQAIFAQQAAPAPSANSPITQTKPIVALQSSSTPGNPETKVWVNTSSGVYHCPGTHWYGATKSGTYMKQSEAQSKGYRPAYHRVCK